MQREIKNIRYELVKPSLKGHHEIIVSFSINGVEQKNVIFVRNQEEWKDKDYLNEAKKQFNKKIESGAIKILKLNGISQVVKAFIFMSIGLAVATAAAVPVTLKLTGYFDAPVEHHYDWPEDLPVYEPGELGYSPIDEYTIKDYNLPVELKDKTTIYYAIGDSGFQKSQTFRNLGLAMGTPYDTKIKLTAKDYDDKIIDGGKLTITGSPAPDEVKDCFPIVPTEDKYSQNFILWDGGEHDPYEVSPNDIAEVMFDDYDIKNFKYYNNADPEKNPLDTISEVGSYTAMADITIDSYGYEFQVSRVFTIKEAKWPTSITYNPGNAQYNANGEYEVAEYNPSVDGFDENTYVYQYGLQEVGSEATPYSSDNNVFHADLQYNHSYNVNISLYNPNYAPAYKLYLTNADGEHPFKISQKATLPESEKENYVLSPSKLNVAHEDMQQLDINDVIVKKGPRPISVSFTYDGKTWDEFKSSNPGTYDVSMTLGFDNYQDLLIELEGALTIRPNEKLYSIKKDRLNQTIGSTESLKKEDIELSESAAEIDDNVTFTYDGESTFPTSCGTYIVNASFTVGGSPVSISGALIIEQATEWPEDMALPSTQLPYKEEGQYHLNRVVNAPANSTVIYECRSWRSDPISTTETPVFEDTTTLSGIYNVTAIINNVNYKYPKTLTNQLTITEGESGVTISMSDSAINTQCGADITPKYTFNYGGAAKEADLTDGLEWVKKNLDGAWSLVETMPTEASVEAAGVYSIQGWVTFGGKYQDFEVTAGNYTWELSIKSHTGTFTCDESCSITSGKTPFILYEGVEYTDVYTSLFFLIESNPGYSFDSSKLPADYITITGVDSSVYSINGGVQGSNKLLVSLYFGGSVRGDVTVSCSTTPHA